jgi:hypothetical protein
MARRLRFAALTALALSVAVLPAVADAETVKFVGTSFRACWEDTEGFTAPPDLQPIPLPSGTPPGTHFLRLTTQSNSGTTIFNTDGTVTSTDLISTSIRNTTTSRVGVSELTCNGTWTLDAAAGRVATTSTCDFTNTVGGASTGTVTAHSFYRLAGTTLIRVDPATPVVETVNVLTGPGAPYSYQRACTVSGVLQLVQ